MTAITPEVIRTNLSREEARTLHINLKRIENKQTYNKFDNRNITTNNTTINNQSKGFFRFILDLLLFPITLPYKIFKHFYIKYDVSSLITQNKDYNNFITKRSKTIKKMNNIQRWNE